MPAVARAGRKRIPARRWTHVAGELCRHAERLRHVPTMAQLRFMANVGGREPVSYALDPRRNWLPESLPGDFPFGEQGLAVTWDDADGFYREAVVLPNGLAFELA